MIPSSNPLDLLKQHIPELSPLQIDQFKILGTLYAEWNEKVNLISRKDIDLLYERHILHSLFISKVLRFYPGARIMDIGTGGGFPGIPLAILYPEVEFILVDSIEKKIKVVHDIIEKVGLKNAKAIRSRAEELDIQVDYVVSRATAPMEDLVRWTKKQLVSGQKGNLPNGWVVLKGGKLKEELRPFKRIIEIHPIKKMTDLPFFDEKAVIYLPRQVLV
jgi:16S rRNA (guanine527-N7)-methyltransferase